MDVPVKVQQKRAQEKETIEYMIAYYCHKKHKQKTLCEECNTLLEYAKQRIDYCPFMESKTFCSNCSVHCYQKERRIQIRNVMRFSGPRMLFHKPIMALRHVYYERKERK
ncbi:MAG: nitrous oxide-stimulated promoter family protein [Longicatena sp.]